MCIVLYGYLTFGGGLPFQCNRMTEVNLYHEKCCDKCQIRESLLGNQVSTHGTNTSHLCSFRGVKSNYR